MNRYDAPAAALLVVAALADIRSTDIVTTIERLIPSAWRNEIVVLDVGVLDAARDGHPQGSTFARVGAIDWIAWRQAITSLAPHVDNDIDDWLGGVDRVEGFPYTITVWNPTLTLKRRAVAHGG